MALIPATIVAEIRDRTDIVAIVAEHVQLRRTGTNHQGLCPFHAEKSPSFTVSAAKQFFYCFGCQKSGDVFRFLMDLTGRTFVEVAQELATRAGVTIPEPEKESRRPRYGEDRPDADSALRARLLRLNELTARYYEFELKRNERVQRYLQERGVAPEWTARFRLGYAPDSWDGLLRVFSDRKVPHELAESAGLLIRREGSAPLSPHAPATPATHYDRFRDRVMFPLLAAGAGRAQTTLGDVVAFGGRVMPSEKEAPGAKYINSPETPLYKKGDHLFGLHSAREVIRKQRQVVLVEGNFDVIALQQQGFVNTVAPMGTALTEAQVRLLARLIGEEGHVVLMLDGDRAGRSATLKDIFLFSETNLRDVALLSGRNIDVRVARLPDGEDPDTFAHRNPEGLAKAVQTAQPAMEYVIDEAVGRAELNSVSGRARILERVLPLLMSIPSREMQDMYIGRISTGLEIRPELLWRRLEQGQAPAEVAKAVVGPKMKKAAPADAAAMGLVSLIADHLTLLPLLHEEVLDSLENPVLSELLRQAREEAASGKTLSIENLIEMAPEEARPEVAAAALSGKFLHSEHPEHELTNICRNIRARAIQREVQDLTQHLKRSGDAEARKSINQRILELNHLRAQVLATNGHMEQDHARVIDESNQGLVAGESPR